MRPFDDQSPTTLSLDDNRLETPATMGYRRGMSSTGVIGRKLGAVYGVDRDLPQEMDSAIRQIQSRIGRTG